MFRFVMIHGRHVLQGRSETVQTTSMSRDDPSSRFDVAAQVPYFAQWDNDGAPWIVGLPGPVDRVLARLVDGEGVKRFESVPATGDWPEDPTKNVVDELSGVKDRFAPRHRKIDEMNPAPRLNCGALPVEGHKARANAKTRAPLARAWPRTSRKAT